MKCWISNGPALAINYGTQSVSGLFETVEDFLHFLSFFPFLSLTFADSVSIGDHIVPVSFPISLILIALFLSLVRYESILFACSVAPIPK